MTRLNTFTCISVLLACLFFAGARAQAVDPIVVSVSSAQLVLPESHLHPASSFRLVVHLTNDSDRSVRVWSEDVTTALSNASGGYVLVTGGPTSFESAAIVPSGAVAFPVFFTVSTDSVLPASAFARSWGVPFTLEVEGVLPPG